MSSMSPMNTPDPLENELRGLQPRAASHGFKRRIVERLSERATSTAPVPWGLALAGALAAACLAAIVLWSSGGGVVGPKQIVTIPNAASPIAAQAVPPTLLAYRHALARSAEELNSLLDQQGGLSSTTGPQQPRIYAFRPSDVERFD